MIELKSSKGLDCIQIISNKVSKSSVLYLLRSAKEVIAETKSLKTMSKLREYFRRISEGLSDNIAIQSSDFLMLIYGVLNENTKLSLSAVNENGAKAKDDDLFTVKMKRKDAVQDSVSMYQSNAHLFMEFGLELFLYALKKTRIGFSSAEELSLYQSLLECFVKGLYSKHESVISFALRCLLNSLNVKATDFSKLMPLLVRRSTELIFAHASSKIMGLSENAAKLLLGCLKVDPQIKLADTQLLEFIKLAKSLLEEQGDTPTPFLLLKCIFFKQYIFPELYDTVDVIGRYCITSQSKEFREKCRSVYADFFLSYPHGQKRMLRSFNFILNNLNYSFESGRESALKLLTVVVAKIPTSLVSEIADLSFVSLVAHLANEESANCRGLTSECLTLLLDRASEQNVDKFFQLLQRWASNSDIPVKRTALDSYKLAFKALEGRAVKYVSHVTAAVEGAFACVKVDREDKDGESMEIEQEGLWQLAYLALSAVEVVFDTLSRERKLDPMNSILAHSFKYLRYPHFWVMNASCSLLVKYFEATYEDSITANDLSAIGGEKGLWSITQAVIAQLQVKNIKEEQLDRVMQAIQFSFRLFYQTGDNDMNNYAFTIIRKLLGLARSNNEKFRTSELLQKHVLKWMIANSEFVARSEEAAKLVLAAVLRIASEDSDVIHGEMEAGALM
ncbi:U3 snoRNP protein [Phlyctochytrium bullatum]|nr:U3 snoRNP protein [Phlyctochytrium bullatum]